MKRLKKVMAMILAIIMVFGLMPGTNEVHAAEVMEQNEEMYPPISVGEQKTVSITERGEKVRFTFVPEESGLYVFESDASFDTYATLYQMTTSGIVQIASNDDGEDLNFSLFYSYVAGETYILEARAYSDSYTGEFSVSLTKRELRVVESIEIEDVFIIENTNGYDDDGTYIYHLPSLRGTVTFTDGSTEEFSGSIEINGEWYSPNIEMPDQYETPWEVNQSYEATARLAGVSTTFKIHIVESPIQSLEVEDVFIIENTNGYDNSGTYIYNEPSVRGTVEFKDGSSQSFSYDIEINGDWYPLDIEMPDQNEEPWEVNQSYEATATILGASTTFKIHIVENPIQSIEIEDVTIIENTRGYDNSGTYIYNEPTVRGTVKFADGSSESFSYSIEINGEWYYPDIEMPDQYEEPWEVNQSYEATATLLEASTVFKIHIVENPIQSIEIEDVTIIENTQGYDDSGTYIYNEPSVRGTVNFKDGSTEEFSSDIEINGEWYVPDIEMPNQYEEPWEVNQSYEATATLAGVSTTFKIHIVESPIESIHIEDVTLLEEGNGYYSDGVFRYSEPSINGTVTFRDGSTKKFSYSLTINDEYYYVSNNVSELQDEEPWTVGNTYTVTATLLGASTTFEVSIVESPVKKVEFKDLVLIEGIDSYDQGNGYEYYYFEPELAKAELKDGSKAVLDDRGLLYNYSYYYPDVIEDSNSQGNTPWTPGNTYTVTGALLGVQSTFNVTIVENPIKDVKVIKMPDKTEYLLGESYNLKGTTIRIEYKDGEYEDIVINKDMTAGCGYYFESKKLNSEAQIYCPWDYGELGNQTIELNIFEKTCVIPVVVKENLIESISIRENKDKTITITVYNSDGTSYDMKLLDIPLMYESNPDMYEGWFFTDKGQFYGNVYTRNKSFAIAIEDGASGHLIKSNSISASAWFKVAAGMKYSPLYCLRMNKNWKYSGKITANNIDQVFEAALYESGLYGEDKEVLATHTYGVFRGEDVRNAIMKVFAVDKVDLSLSKNYNSKDDTYTLYYMTFLGGLGEVTPACPDKTTYKNGVWTIESLLPENKVIKIQLDENGKILTLESGCVEHTWDDGKVTKKGTCKADGTKEYTCTTCGATKKEAIKVAHKYKVTKTTKATTSKNGKITKKCSGCSKTTTETIYYAKSVSLSKTKYTYDGKSHKPTVTVKDSKGNKISSSNYTVSYASGCKNAGSYKVTIKLKGNYSGTLTKTFKIEKASQTISAQDFSKKMGDSSFSLKAKVTKGDGKLSYKSSDTKIVKVSSSGKITIVGVGKATITITAASTKNYDKETEKITITVKPKTTSIKSVTSSDEGELTVKWSKDSAVTHYQVRYSTSSDFDKAIKITASNISELTLEGLEEGETYYVQIRTYKKVDGTKYYSSWSSTKSVKVK